MLIISQNLILIILIVTILLILLILLLLLLLFLDFEKAYDSIKRESLYDSIIKFGIPKKVRLIMTCLEGTQSKVSILVFRLRTI